MCVEKLLRKAYSVFGSEIGCRKTAFVAADGCSEAGGVSIYRKTHERANLIHMYQERKLILECLQAVTDRYIWYKKASYPDTLKVRTGKILLAT